jgi:hypothetical protein
MEWAANEAANCWSRRRRGSIVQQLEDGLMAARPMEYVIAEHGEVHLSSNLRLRGGRTLCGRRITIQWTYGVETASGDSATCPSCLVRR